MANCPVESMTTGGMLWFENLTVADPFYLLPLMTSATLFVQVSFIKKKREKRSIKPFLYFSLKPELRAPSWTKPGH